MMNDFYNIPGYENYEINKNGVVRSPTFTSTIGQMWGRKIPKEMKRAVNSVGYLGVSVSRNGCHRPMSIHRLIAITFIPNPLNKPCINHILDTKGEMAYAAKLKDCQIPLIRNMHKMGDDCAKIGRIYEVRKSTIRQIITGKTWRHIP